MSKKRVYPQGSIAGHITGYVGALSKTDVNNANVFLDPSYNVGKRGLEQFFDLELRGNFGRKRNEVTSRGHIVDSQIYEQTIPGKDLQVSLDMSLQAYAIKRLEQGNYILSSINKKSIHSQIIKKKKSYLHR